MCSILIDYKNWWSHGHPKTLGQINRGILGTCVNQYCTGTYHNYEIFWKFLSETSLTKNCLMDYIYLILDFTLACATHTWRRCKGQIQSHCTIFFWMWFWNFINVIECDGSLFCPYWMCKTIIFVPHWGNATSSVRKSHEKIYNQNIITDKEKISKTTVFQSNLVEYQGEGKKKIK